MSHTSRRRTAAALAGVTMALATTASLSLVAVSGAEAAEPPAGSPIVLQAPDKVTAYSYGRGDRVYSNFGLALVAQGAPFEVWSTRADYDSQIETTWKSGDYEAPLPTGTLSDFHGLPGFVSLKITKVSDGTRVLRQTMDSCLNSWSSQRIRPDAPAYSPYPQGCPWNPYTLGSVMGIQEGWATPLTEEWESSYRLAPGRYDVTATIAPSWRTAFGIADADGIKTVRVEVVKGGRGKAAVQQPTDEGTALQPNAQRPSGPSATPEPGMPAPDLRSLPAFGIGIGGKGTTLRFGATTWNAGNSPMVVDGFRSETDPDAMDAYQYFFDADGNQVGYEPVGEMHWHAANHQHWHFEDFAQYTLLDSEMNDVVRSTKQSWCLANTDAVDYTVEGADWRPENTDLSTACGGYDALSIREVLSSGSGDTYFQFRAGQAFRIKNVPNGIYYIQVAANPLGNLYELDETNNDSLRKIRIGGSGENRWVRSFQVGLIADDFGGF